VFKAILFVILWVVTKNFMAALLVFLLLLLVHFMVKSFWGVVNEFGFFSAIFMLISLSWLFGDDD